MCGWLGIASGLLIDNMTPYKDSDTLNAYGYTTEPLLSQRFGMKLTSLSRLYLNPSSDLN